mmetsp:Transcript_17469/g.25233  ORF Transcript_17469/g.25233 Transcript_17469/m.25233 type:complete len:608 (+) Transcript_17469:57-1880(+)
MIVEALPLNEIITWILSELSYHAPLVVFLIGGLKVMLVSSNRLDQCAIQPTCGSSFDDGKQNQCRIARFIKCKRRKFAQRRSQCMNFGGFPSSKIYFPPPLPYYKNKGCTTQNPDQAQDLGPQSDSGQSVLSDHTSPTLNTDQENGLLLQNERENKSDETLCDREHASHKKEKKQKKRKKKKKSRRDPATLVPSTPLIDLARMQHWSLVVKFTTREGASRRDLDGLIALHWACSGSPPVEAIEAIIKAYPEGAEDVDSEGSTALHFACHYGASYSVVELLLRVNKNAASIKDVYGRSPLWHAMDKSAGEDVIRSLVAVNPLMIISPCIPQDPTKARRIKVPLPRRTPLFLAWQAVVRDRRSSLLLSGKIWDKAQVLLEAAHKINQGEQQTTYFMLHAAVAMDQYLPTQVVAYALQLYPDQIKHRDTLNMGRLPLAVAAASKQLTNERSEELIRLLLAVYPEAATVPDSQGSFSLSLALSSGKSWVTGVQDIFAAAPDLTHRQDLRTKLLPALVSATTKVAKPAYQESDLTGGHISSTFSIRHDEKSRQWQKEVMKQYQSRERHGNNENEWDTVGLEEGQLSTVFSLLQADPSIVRSFPHENKYRIHS